VAWSRCSYVPLSRFPDTAEIQETPRPHLARPFPLAHMSIAAAGSIIEIMSGERVLVVDDEPMVREILARYLDSDGYLVEVAADGNKALETLRATSFDLVLLDLMLPELDGIEVFRIIQKSLNPPAVIMLTARGEEADRIVGLELGADDYITKPFSPREVVARVRAVLRRASGHPKSQVVDLPGLRIDSARRTVLVDGQPVTLTRKEFDLLEHLAAHPGVVFSRTQLMEEVWDFGWVGDSSTITVHIRRLREKIENDPSAPRHLVTVWGVGYKFER
jgi:DNA-binding response OmpR family regulator